MTVLKVIPLNMDMIFFNQQGYWWLFLHIKLFYCLAHTATAISILPGSTIYIMDHHGSNFILSWLYAYTYTYDFSNIYVIRLSYMHFGPCVIVNTFYCYNKQSLFYNQNSPKNLMVILTWKLACSLTAIVFNITAYNI